MAVPPKFLSAVAAASKKYGVPADLLAAQIQAESGWRPDARSPAGALGISQFMPGTAKGYGINPLDPLQSIDAQGKMMGSLLKSYKGDVAKALAAYNAGAGAVKKYGGVPPFAETQNYIKHIEGYRKNYPGLAKGTPKLPLPDGTDSTIPSPSVAPSDSQTPALLPMLQVGAGTQSPQGPSGGLTPGAFMEAALQTLGVKRHSSLGALEARTSAQAAPATLPLPDGTPSTIKPPATSPTMPTNPGGDNLAPVIGEKNGKLIGLPGQGTHKLYGNWESDHAIDIAAPPGTPVYATADGTVGSQIGSLNSSDPHMAGLRVHVNSPTDNFYYQHLAKLAVKAGEKVKKGQIIGYTGALNHLHFASEKADPRTYYK